MANEKRLIDADKLCLKIIDGSYYNNADEDVFWEMVQDEPTVEEAVIPVRCKECRHMEITPDNLRYCNVWERFNGAGDEGYCNYGERKSGTQPQREDV